MFLLTQRFGSIINHPSYINQRRGHCRCRLHWHAPLVSDGVPAQPLRHVQQQRSVTAPVSPDLRTQSLLQPLRLYRCLAFGAPTSSALAQGQHACRRPSCATQRSCKVNAISPQNRVRGPQPKLYPARSPRGHSARQVCFFEFCGEPRNFAFAGKSAVGLTQQDLF